MIEINLLPGAAKKARRLGVTSGLSNAFSGIAGQIKDPYMLAAGFSAVACVAVISFLHLSQMSVESNLRAAEEVAVQDSARFSSVIIEKRKAETQRDSIMRQVRLIQSIDNDRYVWPHILAEVSKSLQPFTWLDSIRFNNPVVSPAAAVPVDSSALQTATTRADSLRILTPQSDTSTAKEPVRFFIDGYTVDVQAMAQMMSDLEDSPWLSGVELVESRSHQLQDAVVTKFRLSALFMAPDPMYVRRTPLTISSR